MIRRSLLALALIGRCPWLCNYGRECGTLKAGSHEVGAILIAEGLAVPFVCGKTRCPATPRPWCP